MTRLEGTLSGQSTKGSANSDVLEFYRCLPFNARETFDHDLAQLRRTNPVALYPRLPSLLGPTAKVLEVGCGTGWFSHAMSYRYGVSVVGIDYNDIAIQRAHAVAEAAGLSTRFDVADLFLYTPETPFDVVVSLGVLHHTNDCGGGLTRVCQEMVRPGGHILIGLYHRYGRRPFSEYFAKLKASGASYTDLLAEYRRLDPRNDETHLISWFRDQVLHPHETHHTLREMCEILEKTDMELVTTSINGFRPFGSAEDLFDRETELELTGRSRLAIGRFYPGFFVFLAKKRS
jgi:SAM-dependent methyltransferase